MRLRRLQRQKQRHNKIIEVSAKPAPSQAVASTIARSRPDPFGRFHDVPRRIAALLGTAGTARAGIVNVQILVQRSPKVLLLREIDNVGGLGFSGEREREDAFRPPAEIRSELGQEIRKP